MKTVCIIIGLTISLITYGQKPILRPLNELINKTDPGWVLVKSWIEKATNKVEILPKDTKRADNALLETQVTTRSPMGAVVYETGGILIDNGWIRILGSGSPRMDRSLMGWNKGKSYINLGDKQSFLLIADDVLGGFFAINAGGLAKDSIGKVFYFAPEKLAWEVLDMGYSGFLSFCFNGNLKKFYEGYRWTGWEKEMATISGNQGVYCYPFLCTKEGKDINKVNRSIVPIQELWDFYMDIIKK